jgi:transposase
LIAVWLYGDSQGVTSARELERQMAYEPGLTRLTGMEVINHHTLSDFRIDHGEALTDLFTQMLVVTAARSERQQAWIRSGERRRCAKN